MADNFIKITRPNEPVIYIATDKPRDVGGAAAGWLHDTMAARGADFENLVRSVGRLFKDTLSDIENAQKVTVEVGMDIGYENGQMIALLVRGKVTATLTLTIEWARTSAK